MRRRPTISLLLLLTAAPGVSPAQVTPYPDDPPPPRPVVVEDAEAETDPLPPPPPEEEEPEMPPTAEDGQEVRRATPVPEEAADAPADAPPAEIPPPPVEEPVLKPKAVPRERPLPPATPDPAAEGLDANGKPKIALSLNTDTNARPLSLTVPAPRGQIVDRNGRPLAQNKIGWYAGIQLPLHDGLKDSAVLDAARDSVAWVQQKMPGGWDITDAKILEHYHKRRWVPLLSASLFPETVAGEFKNSLPAGVVLRPFYLRSYPEHGMASHVIGYMGKNGAMPTGDIVADEPLWTPTIGRYGLEERFDKQLTGTPGKYSVLYNAEGEKLSEDWVARPKAGDTVVTSLDARFQAIVEDEMRQRSVRGAFVIMDVNTGDVISIVSNPGFNPNDWAYGISKEEYSKLSLDKLKPLVPKALQSVYPPASTFKIVTALAALESHKVSPETYFDCPRGMMFGKQWMRNHVNHDEGSMNVVRAIKRSCNPWFWQAARAAGPSALASMGQLLGFGEKTGICLETMEVAGNMPTPEYYKQRKGAMTGGVLANVAIGQGEVSATPLQVCQMMAGVARGDAVPRPRLVRQIQDANGVIMESFPPTVRTSLTISKESLDAVRRGMRAVVADGDGTGTRAENKYVSIAGKTGTGEWHDSPKDYVAWFAGFIPANKPEYAYAAVYEGDPGDSISGGRIVAPIVGDVFNRIYAIKKKTGEEVDDTPAAETDENGGAVTRRSRKPKAPSETASAAAETTAVQQPEKPAGGLRGLLRRLRGR